MTFGEPETPVLRREFVCGAGFAVADLILARGVLAQQPVKTLRFASLYPASHAASRTAEHLAQLVADRTSGRVKFDIFHNASLGGEREVAEGVKSGSIDAGYSGLPGFGSYVRETAVLEMPYLYESLDEVKTIVDRVGPTIAQRMEASGITIVGYLFDGPRVTLSTRPLRSLADFRGLKLRVPQAPVYIQMAQAFGALPTPVALPEVYSALQSRVADALEGTPTSIISSKYHEVATNLTRTDHIFFVAYIGMTTALLKSLSPDDQKTILDAGRDATEFNLKIAKEAVEQDLKRLADAKVNIIAVDKAPFREAVAAMNERFAQGLGPQGAEIYRAIKSVTGR